MSLEKTVIRVTCVDQRLVVSSSPVIASGGINENRVVFDFCPLWDDFAKTAIFYRNKDRVYHALLVDNTCLIPWEVTASDGEMYFGVFGVKGDITRTSEIIKYKITAGAITEDTAPSDPTPDIYEQILEAFRQVPMTLDDHIKSANNPHSVTAAQVGAAKTNHASAGIEYGLASETQYGHVKLMPIQFEAADGGFKTPDGEVITYEDLKGYAASAFGMCVFMSLMDTIIEDIDDEFYFVNEALKDRTNRLKVLEDKMNGLVDAEGVEF